jgi:hypothetical protein
MKIRTAGTPIMAEGFGTVGELQNCLPVKDLQKKLISKASISRLYNLMLQPLYHVLTSKCYSLCITALQSHVTASLSRPYNLMLQSLYHVFTISCYSLYITSLHSKVTAYISRS